MTVSSNGTPPSRKECCVRVAAAGDLHCREEDRDQVAAAFADIDGQVDVVLLAGDLTTHGEPEQAAVLADACRGLSVPVYGVLGNHDWHSNRAGEVVEVLEEAGIRMIDRSTAVVQAGSCEIGVVGAKGFVGGFPGSHLPDFGEPLLRQVYAETGEEVRALDEGLTAIAQCDFRIVLLHYAPTCETLEGERREIWAFLGTDRLAAPILEHGPDLVVHGHAHGGTFEGAVGEVPVYNVSIPVLGKPFWTFELTGSPHPEEALR